MGEKKSKALEQDLMDELLNEVGGDETIAVPDVGNPAPVRAVEDDHTRMAGPSRTAPAGDDKTELSDSEGFEPAGPSSVSDEAGDRVQAAVGRFGGFRSAQGASHTEAALAQSENLRIAQNRLLELEQEIERLRTQNEKLGASGDKFRSRADELLTENQRLESENQHLVSKFEQDRSILMESKKSLQRDLEAARRKTEELELRLSTNISKIRVRERELENRLELVKMEGAAVVRSKDEMILELKRETDQLNLELKNYRAKNQELNRQTMDKQEMLRRTVKALRLALSMLEGEEDPTAAAAASKPGPPQRKIK